MSEHAAEKADVDVRDPREIAWCPVLAVEVDEKVTGDAESEEGDRGSAHDLSSGQVYRHHRMAGCERAPGDRPDQHSHPPVAELVGAERCEERAGEHHP